MTHYRDTRTGRFASRSTWQRSKAHDGTRFKRERERPEVTARRHEPKKAKPLQFFGARTKEAGEKLPRVKVIAVIPAPDNLQTWVEIKTLISHVSLYLPVNVTYNEQIHTPGYVMLDGWLSERRLIEADLTGELGMDDDDRSWEIIPMWSVAQFEPEGMNIQAEIPD